VQIFEDDDPRRCELVEQHGRDLTRVAGRRSTLRNVGERAERRRRRQVLARAVEHGRVDALSERTDERRLADARLAAHEQQPPAFRAGRVELREQLVALEQLGQRVCGKPRSTFDVAGSGQRLVTTLPRV
jgi:hypothetical protein